MRDLAQNYCLQYFATSWMWGYGASFLWRLQKQHTDRQYAKQVLKIRFYFNYSTRCGGTNTQGSQKISNFSFIWLVMVDILNDCMFVNLKLFIVVYWVITCLNPLCWVWNFIGRWCLATALTVLLFMSCFTVDAFSVAMVRSL